MGKKYRKPPIIEALCEFRFVAHQPWDLTIPGLIYERVKEGFPDREQKVGVGVQFIPTEKGIEQRVEPAPPRIQFYRSDRSALMQVAPDVLAVNQLQPYPTWREFKPMILDALKVYREVANPRGLNRIRLRYINKIEFNAETIELSEYFDFYPYLSKMLPQIHTNFVSRVEIPYSNDRDRMLITISNAPLEDSGKISILLDLDYVMGKPEALEIDATEEWLEQSHSHIEETFESCIKGKSRALFEEEG